MYEYLDVHKYTTFVYIVFGGQKKILDNMELDLEMAVRCLMGTRNLILCSTRTASVFSQRTTSSAFDNVLNLHLPYVALLFILYFISCS